jgi:uncharacterized protein (TIGR02265 family)
MLLAETVDLPQAVAQLDLDRRLRETPPNAQTRGVWFAMTADYMRRQGPAVDAAWRAAVKVPSRTIFRMYSLREYMQEVAMAAAVLDPSDPLGAMRVIWRNTPRYYTSSVIGRSCLRLLRPEPLAAWRWCERHREHFCNYGSWRLEVRGSDHVIMHYFDEYLWIDGAHHGGAESLLEACGVEGNAEPEVISPYSGRMHVRWKLTKH